MSFLNSIISTIDDPARPGPSTNPAGSSTKPPGAVGARPVIPPSMPQKLRENIASPKTTGLVTRQPLTTARPTVTAQGPSRSATASPAPRSTGARPSSKPAPQRPMSNNVFPSKERTPAAASAGQPKKGGYLAMLDRAKALQQTTTPAGQIKHQKVTKLNLSRREKERRAMEATAVAKKAGPATGASAGLRPNGASSTIKAASTKPKVETAYKGTMRPTSAAQPAYRGTMGGRGAALGRPGHKNSSGSSRHRSVDYDDDEDDDMDEGMDDDHSASSDMEAGMTDIDEEEMLSAKVARKEDEEAQREENELKRQKLERKRKLEALSSAAAAKRKVY